MDTDIIVSITADGKLELPPKIKHQIKPGDRFQQLIINNYLSLKRRGLTQRNFFISYPLKRGGFKPQFFDKVSIAEDSIIFQKIQQPQDLNDWFRHIEELGPDPNQPSLQEISEMVKQVRQEHKFKK